VNALSLVRDLEHAGVILEARGDRLRVNAPKGVVTPEMREQLVRHKSAIIGLLTTRVDPAAVVAAVQAYEGLWPLTLVTLCRAIVALKHPLSSTPIKVLVAELDGITPEFEVAVGEAAQRAIRAGAIPRRSLDLRR
jgi:hypothetical protein